MAVVKEFKLHSLMRSQKRDEFDKKLKEKHTEAELAEIQKLEELKQKEQEEVNRIRR